jgi:hypothetical protein
VRFLAHNISQKSTAESNGTAAVAAAAPASSGSGAKPNLFDLATGAAEPPKASPLSDLERLLGTPMPTTTTTTTNASTAASNDNEFGSFASATPAPKAALSAADLAGLYAMSPGMSTPLAPTPIGGMAPLTPMNANGTAPAANAAPKPNYNINLNAAVGAPSVGGGGYYPNAPAAMAYAAGGQPAYGAYAAAGAGMKATITMIRNPTLEFNFYCSVAAPNYGGYGYGMFFFRSTLLSSIDIRVFASSYCKWKKQ